ncbi:hypothetical protein [Actinokineospora bangkokensis]|uniref:Uncharacterized protein n=1 Tax=Actinokineospora bangkokensis TaxID=1193682 RepID=A0A1Q9LD39_9PSEU|nr:hypothetical protein [Actinokineospora bangkokensis]OLR89951.1 hypothetical protein BJP25_02900 [Actinokineospora bangkokensis]
MTPEGAGGRPSAATGGAAPRARRKPSLAEIFGDVLPDTTSDERDPAPPEADDWYERNRPPHHGT